MDSYTITGIKQQAKRKDRYSIFVDGTYSFSLSESGVIKLGLKIGRELSKEELADLKDDAVADKAYYQTLGLIARRARSEWEVEDYLRRKDYDPEVIKDTIKKLKGLNYINDKNFAESWVRNRRQLKHSSKRKLIQELRQKRVSTSVIDEVLSEEDVDEQEVLRDLIVKKRRLPRYRDREKLMRYLAGQGFSYGDIKDVLEEQGI